MPRITVPARVEDAPAPSQPILRDVERALGMVPNLHRLMSVSPAALKGYVSLAAALSRGTLGAATGERIALAVSEYNGCDYCLAAHTAIGRKAGLDGAEIAAARHASSSDEKAAAALRFAEAVVKARGGIPQAAPRRPFRPHHRSEPSHGGMGRVRS